MFLHFNIEGRKKLENPNTVISPWPGSCPLTISEWMNYLSSIRNGFHSTVHHFDSVKISGIAYSATLGSLFTALTIPMAISQHYPLIMTISIIGVIIIGVVTTVIVTTNYAVKMMDPQAKSRDKIQSIERFE